MGMRCSHSPVPDEILYHILLGCGAKERFLQETLDLLVTMQGRAPVDLCAVINYRCIKRLYLRRVSIVGVRDELMLEWLNKLGEAVDDTVVTRIIERKWPVMHETVRQVPEDEIEGQILEMLRPAQKEVFVPQVEIVNKVVEVPVQRKVVKTVEVPVPQLVWEHASEDLAGDRDCMLEAAKRNWEALTYAPEALCGDRDFVDEALKLAVLALKYVSERLRGDRAFVLEAVKQDGWVLKYASESLRMDLSSCAKQSSGAGRPLPMRRRSFSETAALR